MSKAWLVFGIIFLIIGIFIWLSAGWQVQYITYNLGGFNTRLGNIYWSAIIQIVAGGISIVCSIAMFWYYKSH